MQLAVRAVMLAMKMSRSRGAKGALLGYSGYRAAKWAKSPSFFGRRKPWQPGYWLPGHRRFKGPFKYKKTRGRGRRKTVKSTWNIPRG